MGNLGQAMAEEDRCVCCGKYAGEGRQICIECEKSITRRTVDLEPYTKDDFKLYEDLMKQPDKGGWIKNIFKRRE